MNLPFQLVHDIIYYKDQMADRLRICILKNLEKEIFKQAHDGNAQAGFNTTYARIAETIYISRLSRQLKKYIGHYPEYLRNQTRRHQPYGDLTNIPAPAIPFHTVAMDFIVALPTTTGGKNALLTVTDKYTKRVLLVPGKNTWTAKQ